MKFDFEKANISYIQVLYKSDETTMKSFKAHLRGISDNTITILGKLDNYTVINTSQEITLDFICQDGLYRCNTKLKYIKTETPYTYLVLEKPKEFTYQQNREFFRVEVGYPCSCVIKGREGTRQYDVETLNISANGICLLFPQKIVTEYPVKLVLSINNKNLEIIARFIRCEQYKNIYKSSFSFQRISDADRDFIAQICIQKQLEERRKQLK